MRFMMMVKSDAASEAGLPPSPELASAVGRLTAEMMQAGVVLEAGGLGPSRQGARLELRGGKVRVVDGPFAEAKELVGGYAILRAGSRDEAIALGKRFLDVHAQVAGPSFELALEIRPLSGPEDAR